MAVRMTLSEKAYQVVAHLIVIMVAAACVIPFLYVVSISLTSTDALVQAGGYVLIPQQVTLSAYRMAFKFGQVLSGFRVSAARVVAGVVAHLLISGAAGYALSDRRFVGYGFFMSVVIFSFVFSPALIPYYVTVHGLGILNKFWMYIIPGAASAWSILIFRQFFMELPVELKEAAIIDGASEVDVFFRVVLPLSTPVFAALGLFNGVWHWNDFMTTLLFVINPKLQPISNVLQALLTQARRWSEMHSGTAIEGMLAAMPHQGLKMAMVVIATVPILVIYPFLQRYFTKGMLTGAIKG